jgi:RNA 3'-terminal phosphate cyclase (ATP)
MRVVDGAMGEGGGQVLRTSLALSLCTGEPVRIENIRAGRKRPGLLRQHLCAVKLAAAISHAEVDGAEPGSRELTFRPRALSTGQHEISIGTAGSATLVLQTVLPALLTAKGTTTLNIEGGTHNPLAPPFEFRARAFLPLINRMGPMVSAELIRPGFYPAGGGQLRVTIEPCSTLSPLELRERGEIRTMRATALVAGLPGSIARRELAALGSILNWSESQLEIQQLPDAFGPGNTLSAVIESEHLAEVFTGYGEKNVTAERVAGGVAKLVQTYLAAGVPVGAQLADQLLLPIALARGGSFRTLPLSKHTLTQLELLRDLAGASFRVDTADREVLITYD